MNPDDVLPQLRALEIAPFRNAENELCFSLRDPTRLAERALAVSPFAYFILMHCDGRTPLRRLQEAFEQQFSQPLPAERVAELLGTLDRGLLLRTTRFAAALQARRAQYAAASARDNREVWPAGDALAPELRTLLDSGEDRGDLDVRGLIAPHLDYGRGYPCYADAYAALRRGSAERYVILGTNHYGESASVLATRKDFLTPLGLVRTDRDFVGRLEARLGWSLCEREFEHLAEHSIELQVHLLQLVHGARPLEIVPVLCPDPCGPTGTQPADGQGPDLAHFAAALRELLAADSKPTVVIASADLSHVGQHFGDEAATTPEFLQRVRDSDQGLLGLLEAGQSAEFLERVRAAQNWSRICSVGCLFALRDALAQRSLRVVRYHQAVNMEAETHVSCAAGVVA